MSVAPVKGQKLKWMSPHLQWKEDEEEEEDEEDPGEGPSTRSLSLTLNEGTTKSKSQEEGGEEDRLQPGKSKKLENLMKEIWVVKLLILNVMLS